MVVGSTPTAWAINGMWRSLVAHLVWDQVVGGSNPLIPIMKDDPEVIEFIEQDTRPFPIAGESVRLHGDTGPVVQLPPTTIPWWLAKIAYEAYNCKHNQSLERIAERGGFGRQELINLIRGDYP